MIAVGEGDARVLREIAAESPAVRPKIERMISYRKRVGEHFQRLVAGRRRP